MTKIISHLGIPGSFSYIAAREATPKMECSGFSSFRQVFAAVAVGQAEAAIVPIENTLAGSIYENYDLLEECGLFICQELNLRIEHCLLSRAGQGNIRATLPNVK